MKQPGVWIGTSGWVYKEWAGNFYPEKWPKRDEFGYYARHFPTVEINATFYRLPTLKMVRGWHDRAPPGFLFAVKGSRFLTHIKRLQDTGRGLTKYFNRLKPLQDRAGPILWQLPPNFPRTGETTQRLERFLGKLPRAYRHAIEFRHPSWFEAGIFSLLRKHRVANVWLSSLRMPANHTVTADFVYLRFHGLQGGAYHDYTAAELRPWADHLADAAHQGLPCFVYFNNDLNTRAPNNAHALMRLVGSAAVSPFAVDAIAPRADIAPPERKAETWPAWNRRPQASASAGRRTSRRTGPKRTRTSRKTGRSRARGSKRREVSRNRAAAR